MATAPSVTVQFPSLSGVPFSSAMAVVAVAASIETSSATLLISKVAVKVLLTLVICRSPPTTIAV